VTNHSFISIHYFNTKIKAITLVVAIGTSFLKTSKVLYDKKELFWLKNVM